MQRHFLRIAVFEYQGGAADQDLADNDLEVSTLAGAVQLRHGGGALRFRGQVDVQAGHLDPVDEEGLAEKLLPVEDVEGELLDAKHRSGAGDVARVQA